MKRVAFYRWKILSYGRTITTRHRMTEAQALEHHPEAVRVDSSLEWREVPESPAEVTTFTTGRPDVNMSEEMKSYYARLMERRAREDEKHRQQGTSSS